MSMGALDAERAPSARTQMFSIAAPFRPDRQGNDRAGDYTELRRALDNKNDAAVRSEIAYLLKQGKTVPQMVESVGLRKLDGFGEASLKLGKVPMAAPVKPENFAGTPMAEADLVKSIKDNPERKALYLAAQNEHADNARHFLKVLVQPETRDLIQSTLKELPAELKAEQAKKEAWKHTPTFIKKAANPLQSERRIPVTK
jgi:hypothetical protein